MRHLMTLRIRPRRNPFRHAGKLVGVIDEQLVAVGRIAVKHLKHITQRLRIARKIRHGATIAQAFMPGAAGARNFVYGTVFAYKSTV